MRDVIARHLLTARREKKQGRLFWAGWWAGIASQLAEEEKTGNQVSYIVCRMGL